jgi:hypothetical protein
MLGSALVCLTECGRVKKAEEAGLVARVPPPRIRVGSDLPPGDLRRYVYLLLRRESWAH